VKSDGVHTIRLRIVDVVVVVLETNKSTMLFKNTYTGYGEPSIFLMPIL